MLGRPKPQCAPEHNPNHEPDNDEGDGGSGDGGSFRLVENA